MACDCTNKFTNGDDKSFSPAHQEPNESMAKEEETVRDQFLVMILLISCTASADKCQCPQLYNYMNKCVVNKFYYPTVMQLKFENQPFCAIIVMIMIFREGSPIEDNWTITYGLLNLFKRNRQFQQWESWERKHIVRVFLSRSFFEINSQSCYNPCWYLLINSSFLKFQKVCFCLSECTHF